MPYNTRRKSLSLADLGVVLPKRSRAISHPSPPSTIAEGEESERPAKVSKTTHVSTSPPRGAMSPPRTTLVRIKEENPKQELSPPPSPAAEGCTKVNLEGLSDDIVVATILQLEETGNRPIFVRELAALLATRLHSVEKSANPTALISSRLTAYLNRSWPTISPCPLAKDLSPVHPRRLYFYLTTMPKQPVPEPSDLVVKPHRIISPSISSASVADEEEDERYTRNRQALSPSPEVDLSSPELDNEDAPEPPTPGAPFSGRNSASRSRATSTSDLSRNRRAASPQLEHEERDFKQTASALHEQALQRRNSQQSQTDVSMDGTQDSAADRKGEAATPMVEETEESAALRRSEDAAALFGQADHLKPVEAQLAIFSSPLIEPQVNLRIETSQPKAGKIDEPMEHLNLDHPHPPKDADVLLDWDALQSPENVEMAELEDLFDAY